MTGGRAHRNACGRRRGWRQAIGFFLFLAALTAFLLWAVPRLLNRDVLAAQNHVGCISFFRDQTASFPIAIPDVFSPAPERYQGSMYFESAWLLEEMTATVENKGFETQEFRRPDGSGDLFITGTAESGGLCYYYLRSYGNSRFLLRQEAVVLSGGGELMFPCHLDSRASGESRITPGQEYETCGTLREFYDYYQHSGRYQTELREDSVFLRGYTELVPDSAPEFPGPCEIFVTETAEGNTVRVELV